MNPRLLAYRKYPAPEGTNYYEADLNTEEKVIQLFDYCQILEAHITQDGWKHLIEVFGMQRLFELNQKSGWYDCETVDEFASLLVYQLSGLLVNWFIRNCFRVMN
ncbi:MAG: hypothetical protein AAGK97_00555 [Bacteroidota bacterium]